MLFSYMEKKTIIHALDPRTKIMWLGIVMLLAVLINLPVTLLILFLLTIIPIFIIRIPIKSMSALLGMYFIVALGATVSQAFFYSPSGDVQLTQICIIPQSFPFIGEATGGIYASYEGAVYGFVQAFRILSMMNASICLVISTPLSRIITGLRDMGMPSAFAFMLSTAVRFVPTIMEEYEIILTSLRARNILSLRHPIRLVENSFSPLIINSIRRCNQLALAAESRAFDASVRRTSYLCSEFKKPDYMAFIVIVIVVFSMTVFSI